MLKPSLDQPSQIQVEFKKVVNNAGSGFSIVPNTYGKMLLELGM